jgi:hypothetical protein
LSVEDVVDDVVDVVVEVVVDDVDFSADVDDEEVEDAAVADLLSERLSVR